MGLHDFYNRHLLVRSGMVVPTRQLHRFQDCFNTFLSILEIGMLQSPFFINNTVFMHGIKKPGCHTDAGRGGFSSSDHDIKDLAIVIGSCRRFMSVGVSARIR